MHLLKSGRIALGFQTYSILQFLLGEQFTCVSLAGIRADLGAVAEPRASKRDSPYGESKKAIEAETEW